MSGKIWIWQMKDLLKWTENDVLIVQPQLDASFTLSLGQRTKYHLSQSIPGKY